MTEIEVSIPENDGIELKSLDIGVEENVISFDISGKIQTEEGDLTELEGESLILTKVVFGVE